MDNLIGLHTCYWQGTAIGRDLHAVTDFTRATGADIIEVSASDFIHLSKAEVAQFREYAEASGLSVSVNGGLVTPRNDISSPDPVSRLAGLKHCQIMLELCAALGSPTWSGLIHSAWLLRPDPADPVKFKKMTKERAVEGMIEVSAIAAKTGVVCCLEIVNRYEQFVLNTVTEGIDFCENVNSPFCKLLLDTFHMSIEEDDMAQSIQTAQQGGHIGYIHVGESNRRIPIGEKSNINWRETARAIRTSGYSGPLVLEPLELDTTPAAAKVCIWRSFADPNDLDSMKSKAMQSIAYLRKL